MNDNRKDSATMTSSILPSASKPKSTRTPSTRNPGPSHRHSKVATNPSDVHHTHSTASKRDVNARPKRPEVQRRRTTAQTKYIDMLLGLDDVPKLHNILASFFTWILLAGYIIFPATYNKFQKDKDIDEKANNAIKASTLATVRNVPLLYVAAFACGIGTFGCLWLWFKHYKNYVWVINRIFLPALMNSVAGLISTLINIYSAQEGQFSVTARATIIATAVCSVVTAALFLLYNSVMLSYIKRKHQKETKAVERSQSVREVGEKVENGDVSQAV